MSQIPCAYQIEERQLPFREESPLYTRFYRPEKMTGPLIVFSHEVGHSHRRGIPYAEHFAARGCPVLLYDFHGGSNHSLSGTDTARMTALTEQADLEAVLAWAGAQPELSGLPLVLLGASQGGFVSVLEATEHPEDFAALICIYPALQIPEEMRATFGSRDRIPALHDLHGWMTIGREYTEVVWDLDIYARMPRYTGPVLLLHGDADLVVNAVYSERASHAFPDAEFHRIPGGDHGFKGEPLALALDWMDRFLNRIGLL